MEEISGTRIREQLKASLSAPLFSAKTSIKLPSHGVCIPFWPLTPLSMSATIWTFGFAISGGEHEKILSASHSHAPKVHQQTAS